MSLNVFRFPHFPFGIYYVTNLKNIFRYNHLTFNLHFCISQDFIFRKMEYYNLPHRFLFCMSRFLTHQSVFMWCKVVNWVLMLLNLLWTIFQFHLISCDFHILKIFKANLPVFVKQHILFSICVLFIFEINFIFTCIKFYKIITSGLIGIAL